MADKPERDIDEDLVRQLAQLLEETNLTEIEYGRGDWHIRVVKSGGVPVAAQAIAPVVHTAPDTPPAPDDAEEMDLTNAVTSPMVGTAYLSAEPGAAPFVQIGQQVAEGETLMIVEAMKTMNHIPSPRAGTVKRILVDDGSPVEFGAPLMVVE